MIAKDYSDQIKFFDPTTVGFPVHIIGAGGIGNMIILLLAKMGFREIEIWDDDYYEQHNGPTEVAYSDQFFGQPKIEVAKKTIDFLLGDSDIKVTPHPERVTADTELEGYVICGVDSMASRSEIWQCIQACAINIPVYIDARSAGEQVQVFTVQPLDMEDVENYESWLFDDQEATPLGCGARNIGYMSTYIGSIIAKNLTAFIRGDKVPFMVQKDLSNSF